MFSETTDPIVTNDDFLDSVYKGEGFKLRPSLLSPKTFAVWTKSDLQAVRRKPAFLQRFDSILPVE